MASIQRLSDALLMGIRHSTAQRSARCRRLTPHPTARSQANRLTLWLLGWEVETSWLSGVPSIRWCLACREAPCATMNRYWSGVWPVARACLSTAEGSWRPQSVEVVSNARCKSRWRRSHGSSVVPCSRAEPTPASAESAVTADANGLCTVTALLPPSPHSHATGDAAARSAARHDPGHVASPLGPAQDRHPAGSPSHWLRRRGGLSIARFTKHG